MISLDAMPVPLANNKGMAWVDADHHALVSTYRWYLHKAGRRCTYASARIPGGNGKKIYLHSLVARTAGLDAKTIDHKDGNGLNCTIENLRKATRAQNNSNRPILKNNTSKYIGVTWHEPAQKWCTHLSINNKHRYLGVYEDITVAARVYDAWALAARGEFAVLNFPEEAGV